MSSVPLDSSDSLGQSAPLVQLAGPRRADASPVRAYQDLAVGSRSLLALLRYELLVSWGAMLPGAVGLALRKALWPRLFGRAGRRLVFGRGVVLRHPEKMWIGDGVMVDDLCHFDAKGSNAGEFVLGDGVVLSRGTVLNAKQGPIELGPRVNLGAGCMVFADGGVRIGADTMLAARCYIGGGLYDVRTPLDVPMSERPLLGRGVDIGEACWLGAGVVVIDGVRIGRGTVVGAGAVVTRDLPAYSVAVGAPARVIRSRGIQRCGDRRANGGEVGAVVERRRYERRRA